MVSTRQISLLRLTTYQEFKILLKGNVMESVMVQNRYLLELDNGGKAIIQH